MTSVSSAVPTHGNYHNYHGYLYKHPGGSDSRLALLPRELLANARVLDVGCNEGWVSCEMAQSRAARRVIGVDIDSALVRMAWRRRRTLWSHQAPLSELSSPYAPAPAPPAQPTADHFPASCQHMFENEFPHNVSFRRADWVNERIPEDDAGYDVIIAFSVSKRFFERVHEALVPGGAFVLEPQPRESYIKARKLHPTLQENAQTLQIQPENFEAVLCSIGFRPAQRLGEHGEGRFHRPVDLYIKQT
ncbi:S-adenosyl-L-methionine-dependent methyltransferase [Lactifluus volemus]|nr:S-adenosyl-L-methionine-dependent methyltransferase [Lactifluus volemus]